MRRLWMGLVSGLTVGVAGAQAAASDVEAVKTVVELAYVEGPPPEIHHEFASVDIAGSAAVARVEIHRAPLETLRLAPTARSLVER